MGWFLTAFGKIGASACYVNAVFWITTCFHIMLSPIADASRASTQSNYPEDSTGPRAKSAIYDCPVNTSVNYTDAACAANQDLRNGRLSVRPSVCLNHCPLCCNEGNQGMSLERGKE